MPAEGDLSTTTMHDSQHPSTAASPPSGAMPRGLPLAQMRHLVDLVTQQVTESSMVLGTETIDGLIAQAFAHAETVGNHAGGLGADAGSPHADAPQGLLHASPALAPGDPDGPQAGFKSWREAAESERATRVTAQQQRGMARAELHAVCELLKAARQRISLVVTPAANLASEVSRQEAVAQLDAALAIRHTIPVPGDEVRYRRLRLIGCTPDSSGALAPLTRAALDSFVDMDLISNPDAEDDAFGFLETPSEMALRAIASYLGVGGYNAPIADAEAFQTKIIEEIGALSARSRDAAKKPPSEFTTGDDDLNALLDFVAMMFAGGGNHDAGIGFRKTLEKVEARLIPADARPAARLTVTAEFEGGEPEIVEVTVASKFPVGTHELHALPSRLQIPVTSSEPEPLASLSIET